MDEGSTDDSGAAYKEDVSKSEVDDGDLDQMIASIKGQPAPPTTVVSSDPPAPSNDNPITDGDDQANTPVAPTPAPEPAPIAPPVSAPPSQPAPSPIAASAELANIKLNALAELRPLVDKLTISPEEKFNTILLIIRSTDDATLLPSAYEVARTISDENRRAQALLDIIKEADFFSKQAK